MKKVVPVLILCLLGGVAFLIMRNPPEVERQAPPSGPQMVVDVVPLVLKDYQVKVASYGTVQPRTQSVLVAQVSGEVISINDSLRDGGFFEAGEVLLRIDPRDYEADVKIAEAALMDARQALAQERARSVQAREDWQRLGNEGAAPDLVLRKPQLLAAESRVVSAQSALDKARLELERTVIKAPYVGRVMNKMVDVGQVVNTNSQLAEVYSVDLVEIRLPLRNRDLSFVDLPEDYRFDRRITNGGPPVTIRSDLGGGSSWKARVVRTESTIDDSARQLHVVAQVDDPFGSQAAGRTPLKIGQYVTAEIEGRKLDQALVIPNSAIYQGSYVYVVEDEVLQRRNVEIAWQNEEDAIVNRGLQAGELLVLTSLGQVTSGLQVAVRRQEAGAAVALPGSSATGGKGRL